MLILFVIGVHGVDSRWTDVHSDTREDLILAKDQLRGYHPHTKRVRILGHS